MEEEEEEEEGEAEDVEEEEEEENVVAVVVADGEERGLETENGRKAMAVPTVAATRNWRKTSRRRTRRRQGCR